MTCSTLLSTTGTTRSKEKNGENYVIIITALGYKTSKKRHVVRFGYKLAMPLTGD